MTCRPKIRPIIGNTSSSIVGHISLEIRRPNSKRNGWRCLALYQEQRGKEEKNKYHTKSRELRRKRIKTIQ